MRIDSLELGKSFKVKSIKDKEKPILRKLSAMGLREGASGQVLLKNGRVILLRLNGSRLIIDKEIAGFIEVA